MDRGRSPGVLLVTCLLSIAAVATAQMGPTLETSALLASPGLSPEAREAIRERVEAVHAKFRASHGGMDPEQFGVQCCQVTQIPAAAFASPGGGEDWSHGSFGYIYPSTLPPGVYDLWAPVMLPSGVEIQFMDLYYYDNDAVSNLSAALLAFSGGGILSGPPTTASLATASSAGNPGYGYAAQGLTYTVNNHVGYDPNAAQLALAIFVQVAGIDLQFKAVDLWWMRQVSPAPSVASFSDVPTNHSQFQFIEALAASAITAGCGGGNYCPDASLTRGQMAVFLAKALGLYWRY
jgi:S-layer homology domain